MNFVWNMTEENFKNLKHDYSCKDETDYSHDFDVYGSCYVGNLCAEIHFTGIMRLNGKIDKTEPRYCFTYIFALGIDDGYGETREGHIPYSLLDDGIKVPIRCKTFDSFKEEFENRFKNLIEEEHLKELANMPLGNWN